MASVVNNNLNNLDEQVQPDYQTESWETTTRVGRLEEVFLWQGQALRTQDVSLAGT